MTQDQEREAFEAWAKNHHTSADTRQFMWAASQAAIAAQAPTAEHEDTALLDFLDDMGGDWFARQSGTGRGFRLHQDTGKIGQTVRDALREAAGMPLDAPMPLPVQAPTALTDLECPPDPDTVDRELEKQYGEIFMATAKASQATHGKSQRVSSGEAQKHAAKGRAIVKRLYNDPADSISLVSVGEWIEYAAQLLALNEKPTFFVGELPADFFADPEPTEPCAASQEQSHDC